MTDNPFSKRTLRVLYWLGGISLLAGFLGSVLWPGTPGVLSSGADSFSSSAIGHRAFFELLRESGRAVIRSRGRSARKAKDHGVLVLLEPTVASYRIEEMVGAVPRSLVVLPKWEGDEDPEHRGWLGSVELVDPAIVTRTLGAVAPSARVVRKPVHGGVWHSTGSESATLSNVQLVTPQAGLVPVIDGSEGMLLGRVEWSRGAEVWVLSDPDVLSNHGLGKGDNAELIAGIISRIAGDRTTIVIDETLHGFAVPPHIWGQLARFPLVLAVGQALLAMLVLVWGARRFGAPEPEQLGLGSGKSLLIHNTADLLRFGGHSASVLSRYFAAEQRRVASAFHLPPGLPDKELESRLARLETAYVTRKLAEIKQLVASAGAVGAGVEASTLRTAQLVWKWREEMLGGT